MSLDDVVNITISARSRTASVKGFGVPMIARYHNYFTDTVRSYSNADDMLSDGFPIDDPAYLVALAVFSQEPAPDSIMVGKRASAFTQLIDLTPATPVTGLDYHVTVDGNAIDAVAVGGNVLADICTGLAAYINTSALTDNPNVAYSNTPAAGAIIATGASTTGIQTITGAGLNGAVGATAFTPARRISLILSSHADWDATTAVLTGKNTRGQTISENLLIPNNGNVTVQSVKVYTQITQLVIPAQSGSGGTFTLGLIARAERVDETAIIEAGASTAGVQTITGASLNGDVGVLPMSPGRMLQFTFSSHTDWDATTAVVTGTAPGGAIITENFAIPNNGNATVKGLKVFKTVTQVSIPAQTGTNGTFVLGTQSRVIADGTSGTHVRCTTQTPGVIVPYDSWINTQGGSDSIAVLDSTVDPGIATDLATILAANSAWYGLLIDSNSKAEILATAAWAEAQKIVFFCQTADSEVGDSASTTDVMYAIDALQYARTLCQYHPSIGEAWIAAADLGDLLPTDPGSSTGAFATLAGIPVYNISDTKVNAILAKNGGVYIQIAGLDVTQVGKSASGEFIDIVIFVDWLHARLQERIFTVIYNARQAGKKIPYTNGSVALFVGEILAQLKQGVTQGGLIANTLLAAGPDVATVSPSDRANRLLPGLTFAGQLAGAVNRLTVNGNVYV